MKAVKISVLFLIILTVSVYANSLYIGYITDNIAIKIENITTDDIAKASSEFEKVFEEFKKAEKYISITVSHDDLTNIEDSFSEIIGAAKAGNTVGVITVKSRLKDSLLHLGRLSGINIDSIL